MDIDSNPSARMTVAAPEAALSARVLAEFREMPGLRLTLAQAARLFNLDLRRCDYLMRRLVDAGLLRADGRFFATFSLIFLLALVSPAVAVGQSVSRNASNGLAPLVGSSEAIEMLVNRVMPSVAQIVATGFRPEEAVSQLRTDVAVQRGRTVGSGVVIDGGGYILTNAHVIDGAEKIEVMLAGDSIAVDSLRVAGAEARVFEARVVGKSDDLDLALLSVDAKGLRPLPLADYNAVRQGQLVFAFGSPDALRNSVSMGVVSAVAQQAESGSAMVWIQTDAAVNPGNSGGPLVNVKGELVGLNTFIRSMSGGSEGLGFAVPSAVIAVAYPQLRQYGHLHRATLGVVTQPITRAMRKGLNLPTDLGVIVADLAPRGPGAAAGVQIGDVITGIDGESLETMSWARLQLYLLALGDGQPVALNVLRGTDHLTLTATARVPPHRCAPVQQADLRANVIERLGFIGAPVDQSVSEMLRAPSGVVVLARVETQHAAALPLSRGDVIHAINGTFITTPAELREAVARLESGAPVVLQVERNGELSYVTYELD